MTSSPARRPLPLAILAVLAVVLPIDLATANRGIGFIDRGELAAVAAGLGIAHPTGYPTFTLLGHLVTRLVPLPPVLALNLFAALLSALGAAVLVALYDELLRPAGPGHAERPGEAAARARAAAIGALVTASGSVWWQQANGWEVYALQALLLPLAALTFLRWLRLGGLRAGLAFAFAGGLALTNHLTIVLAIPAAVVAVALDPRRRERVRELPAMAAVTALAITPYAYLPLRAAMHPAQDWNEPDTFARFVNHVSAREFRGWMFASGADFTRQAVYAARVLPADLAWAGLAAALAGLAALVRLDARRALFTLLLLAGGLVYACGYGIRDIDAYLLTCVVVLGAWVAAAAWALRARARPAVVLALGAALVVGNGALHWRDCDESRLHLAEDLARAQLAELPPHAVLISAQWDYALSPDLYLQQVEHLRPDVTVIGQGTLRQPWAVRALRRSDPSFLAPVATECDSFLAAAAPFEAGRPFDAARIGAWWERTVNGAIAHARAHRPVFVTLGVEPIVGEGLRRVPVGLAFALESDSAYVAAPRPHYRFRPWRQRIDTYVATTSWIYAQSLAQRAGYELAHGRRERAHAFLAEALRFDPGIAPDRVPVQPLDGDELVRQSAAYFEQLRAVRLP